MSGKKVEMSRKKYKDSIMELPTEIVEIIKEYSRPVTRSDWRYLHKYPVEQLEKDIDKEYKKSLNTYGYYYENYNVIILPTQYRLFLRALIHSHKGDKYNAKYL